MKKTLCLQFIAALVFIAGTSALAENKDIFLEKVPDCKDVFATCKGKARKEHHACMKEQLADPANAKCKNELEAVRQAEKNKKKN